MDYLLGLVGDLASDEARNEERGCFARLLDVLCEFGLRFTAGLLFDSCDGLCGNFGGQGGIEREKDRLVLFLGREHANLGAVCERER